VSNGVHQDTARLGEGWHSGEKFRDHRLLHNAGCVVARPEMIASIFESADFRKRDKCRLVPFLATDFFLSFGSWTLGKRVFLPSPSLARMDMDIPSIILEGRGDTELRGSERHYDPRFHRLPRDIRFRRARLGDSHLWGIEGDWIHNFHVKQQRHYESAVLHMVQAMELRGTYLDIGAHCGNHTDFFSSYTRADQIIAVEPQPDCFSCLMWNTEYRRRMAPGSVQLVHAAIHDTWSHCGIKVLARANLGATQVRHPSDGNSDYNVRCVPADGLLPLSQHPISFMKIDVEGAEPAVLRSAKTILGQKPVLMTEAWKVEDYQRQSALLPDHYKAFGPFTSDGTTLWLPEGKHGLSEAFSGRERAR